MFGLLADAEDDIDRWLAGNPLVLGGITLTFGVVMLVWGAITLKNKVAMDKYGRKQTGGLAVAYGVLRLVFGLTASAFGIFKIAQGIL